MPSVDKKNGGVSPTPANTDRGFLLRFGAFTVDLNRHGLFMGSTRIHLTSKPFETLVVLMEHRGTTVQKQQLMDAVWKDSFVTEDSLVKAIREIRRALDDEKGNPKFIQTVPGEGYRFIAEVTSMNEQIGHASAPTDVSEKETEASSAPTVVTPPSHAPRRRLFAVAAAVLVLIGIISVSPQLVTAK
jgi:DNA-binding winged helix-turn-helix (wHTH) protein